MNPVVAAVTARIEDRSQQARAAYEATIQRMLKAGPARGHLSCSNLAHAAAAAGEDQQIVADGNAANIGIITAYNDMLSAHQPFERFPALIKQAAREKGATAQVAGGVPAMCDGVTQGQPGMELSLFSRDVIALSAGVALSHNCFDAAIYLGVCDKIVPGLVIAAATFGHLPTLFSPAGPMPSGLPNDEKAKVRQRFATGEVDRAALLEAEMKAYHGPGTCTFYGTANSNQMLMEIMGLHLPGSTFVQPNTQMRDALTRAGTQRLLDISLKSAQPVPVARILTAKNFVNGIVGLHATGGSTNLLLHLVAMARAAGVLIELEDFAELAEVTPLLARVYPNGLADVNHFHAAGGLQFIIGEALDAGLMHEEVQTIAGQGLSHYLKEPKLQGTEITFHDVTPQSLDPQILKPVSAPFQPTGGVKVLTGPLGRAVTKISAVKPENRFVEAPCRVFHDQDSVKAAFKAGEFTKDTIFVIRFQGPKANGMPELHSLTPTLAVLQDRGLKVAMVTDGRMSGASGKVPNAIHVSPEAADGGPIARLRDGDILRLDCEAGTLEVLTPGFQDRPAAQVDLTGNQSGVGRELFETFRQFVGRADHGASPLYQ